MEHVFPEEPVPPSLLTRACPVMPSIRSSFCGQKMVQPYTKIRFILNNFIIKNNKDLTRFRYAVTRNMKKMLAWAAKTTQFRLSVLIYTIFAIESYRGFFFFQIHNVDLLNNFTYISEAMAAKQNKSAKVL